MPLSRAERRAEISTALARARRAAYCSRPVTPGALRSSLTALLLTCGVAGVAHAADTAEGAADAAPATAATVAPAAIPPAEPPKPGPEERLGLHFQTTVAVQAHPAF